MIKGCYLQYFTWILIVITFLFTDNHNINVKVTASPLSGKNYQTRISFSSSARRFKCYIDSISMSYVIENNIIKTEPVEFDFAALGGMGNILFKAMKKYRQNIALIDPDGGRQDTYEYILQNAIRTAIAMKQKGIKSRDIVMGSSDNHLDACVPILAALFLGAIPCSMDPCITPTEVIHIIDQVKPKLIFTIPSSLKLIKEACHELNVDIEIVVFGSPEFRFFTERQNGEDGFEPVISQDPKETSVIYFSSGTTGLAKACCLSHVYFIKQSSLVPSHIAEDNLDLERRNFEWLKFKNDGTFLSYYPLYWLTAGKIIFEMFIVGGTCVLGKKFDPEQFWHIVEKFRVCLAMLSPFAISELAKYGKPPNFNADSLVKILTGGAVSQTKYWKLLQDILPDIDILQNYGLTETGIIAYYEAYNKVHREHYMTHPESIGFPVRGVWYKVVDPQTEKVLGPNQEGELYVKSEFFTNGYYSQPYDDVFDTDGWFRTGDVVYYTDNCALYLTNRLKELMKYRQLTVYPYVLEKELLKHPAVAQAAVLGIPHEDDGDHPAAFVVLKRDSGNVKAEEIRKFVDERVQDKAKLRGGVRVVDSFPITSTGKLKRVQLRKMVLEE